MTWRAGPMRAAAILAAVFVVARVGYRVLFDGTDGAGRVLIALPSVRLPPPVAHVVLGGPVTAGGLWDAVASALPIAAVIVACGLLNALVDVSRVLRRVATPGPFGGIARALAIAWASLPALADAARAVRTAQRLTGRRPGPRILAPLLERTLERAARLAAALELRGFGGRGLEGDCLHPVEVRDATLAIGAARVQVPDLALAPSSLTVVTGPTGAGKSVLLRTLAGLHSHTDGGTVSGAVRVAGHDRTAVAPRDTARLVGVVLQDPREAFATETVRDEIGLALELRGVASVIVSARVAALAGRIGVADLLDRPVRALSAGEATLVAIAAAVIEQPILLLVDEPLADLDGPARGLVVAALDALAHEAGVCVVVAEHRAESLAPVTDRWWSVVPKPASAAAPNSGSVVREGRMGTQEATPAPAIRSSAREGGGRSVAVAARPDPAWVAPSPGARERNSGSAVREGRVGSQHGTPATAVRRSVRAGRPASNAAALAARRAAPASTAPARAAAGVAPVLAARHVAVCLGGVAAVRAATVEVAPGEIVALVGPNGAGKSSLLLALALPGRGQDVCATGRVVLVPDASDNLFTRDTVAAELRAADRRAHAPGAAAALLVRFLGAQAPATLGGRHPRDLSLGQRRCLAIAVQLAGAPNVLLIDEPTRGLDAAAAALVAGALREAAADGAGVLVATHDPDFPAALGARVLAMRDGFAPSASGTATADDAARLPGAAGAVGAVGAGGAVRPSSAVKNGTAHPTDLWPPDTVRSSQAAASIRFTALPDAPACTETLALPDATARIGTLAHADALVPPDALAVDIAAVPPGRAAARHPESERSVSPVRGRASAGLPAALLLAAANLVAFAAFAWPFAAAAVPAQAQAALPYAAVAVVPAAAIAAAAALDGTVRSAHTLAFLGVLAAVGAAVRIASTGVGGVEAVFVLLILAGRAFGARFGMLLGLATIAVSSVLWGGLGPWTPFQLFACAWVGAGAGLLPQRVRGAAEIGMLALYGIVASYAFGLLMNLWFWPFAVGGGTGISYVPGGPAGQNLGSFLLYSLITSTLSFDTVRAVTTVVGLLLVGRAVLASARRAKPVAASAPAPSSPALPTRFGRHTWSPIRARSGHL